MGKSVYYTGRVQGVGFRATVADIARTHPVTGWVRNLPDGRVQVLVEGADEAVEAFLAAVRQRWARHIHAEQAEDREPTGRYTGFDIVR
jgi:acylphosphatase